MRAAIAMIALVLGACADDSFTGLLPAQYNGMYNLQAVNGDSLPVAVETSSIEGTVVAGELLIDYDTNYWLSLSVFQPGAGVTVIRVRGNAIPNESGEELSFVDRNFDLQWVGERTDTTIVIPDLKGLHAVFRRVSEYRSPS